MEFSWNQPAGLDGGAENSRPLSAPPADSLKNETRTRLPALTEPGRRAAFSDHDLNPAFSWAQKRFTPERSRSFKAWLRASLRTVAPPAPPMSFMRLEVTRVLLLAVAEASR